MSVNQKSRQEIKSEFDKWVKTVWQVVDGIPRGHVLTYGEVARLAGMPQDVVSRAKEILTNLEEGEFGEGGQPKIARHRRKRVSEAVAQLDLFAGE